jgi:hypothetical protein
MTRDRPSWMEIGIASGLLLLLGIAAFYSHLRHGGFYYDDWSNAALTHYSGSFGNTLTNYWHLTSYRPVLVLYVPLTHIVFGTHMHFHLLWSVGLGVLQSASLYLLLRTLRVERIHSAAIAALVLIFPTTDSTRLWATASMTSLAISFYLLGATVALHGIGGTCRRPRLVHAGAVALYALSVGTYEATAGLVLFSFFLYWCATNWRRALSRSAVDAAVLAAMLLTFTPRNSHPVQSFHTQVLHAKTMLTQGLTVLSQAAVPFGQAQRLPVLLPMVAIVALAAWRWARTRALELQRWLVMACLSAMVIVAGYAVFIPADPYYSPLRIGLGNRTNVVSALGLIPLVYSVAVLAGLLLFQRMRLAGTAAALTGALVAVVVGLGYLHDLRADETRWDRAFLMEEQALGVMRGVVKHPPRNATLYSFDWPGFATPGVTVFSTFWDLNGAVKLQWHDGSLQGYPVLAPVTCGPTTLKVPADPVAKPYGNVFFIDIPMAAGERIRNRAQCIAATQRFHPGIAVAAPS